MILWESRSRSSPLSVSCIKKIAAQIDYKLLICIENVWLSVVKNVFLHASFAGIIF